MIWLNCCCGFQSFPLYYWLVVGSSVISKNWLLYLYGRFVLYSYIPMALCSHAFVYSFIFSKAHIRPTFPPTQLYRVYTQTPSLRINGHWHFFSPPHIFTYLHSRSPTCTLLFSNHDAFSTCCGIPSKSLNYTLDFNLDEFPFMHFCVICKCPLSLGCWRGDVLKETLYRKKKGEKDLTKRGNSQINEG